MWRASARSCLDKPADASGPPSINDYLVEVEDAAAIGAGAKKFKVDPQRLLYSLQWNHNGTPPDFHLQLATEPALWFDFVATLLLGALSKHEPELRDRLRAAAPA
jgi:hypothetical protein